MRINSSAGLQEAALDDSDSGEGLAIFFSQNAESEARYRFQVKAIIDQGIYDVGEFYGSPPAATPIPGRLSRMVAGVICPGATGWRVSVSCVNNVVDDTADIVLASSRSYAQMGITRVSERYAYEAGSGIQNFIVRPGMKVTSIGAIGLAGGGTVVIDSGDIITVPDGISANLEPGTSISYNSVIAFTNVDWIVEYLESA